MARNRRFFRPRANGSDDDNIAIVAVIILVLIIAITAVLYFLLKPSDVTKPTPDSAQIQTQVLEVSGTKTGASGLLENFTTTAARPLTDGSSIFEIDNAMPLLKQQATVKAINSSDNACNFGIMFHSVKAEDQASVALSELLKISVFRKGELIHEFILSECENTAVPIARFEKLNDSSTFVIQLEFLNSNPDKSNAAMGGNVTFDMDVYLIQS